MASWTVSPILVPLISELKDHHPGIVIGTIGDPAHQAEATGSDHNPDQWGFVCAEDSMIGPAFTAADAEHQFQRIVSMIRAGDKRCAYVIYNRRICSSTVSPGVIRNYTGTDPHTGHVHTSVPHGSDPHPTTSWNIYEGENMADVTLAASEFGKIASAVWAATFGSETASSRLANIDTKIDVVATKADLEAFKPELVTAVTDAVAAALADAGNTLTQADVEAAVTSVLERVSFQVAPVSA